MSIRTLVTATVLGVFVWVVCLFVIFETYKFFNH